MKHLLIAIVSVPLALSVGAMPSVVPSGEVAADGLADFEILYK